MTTKEFISIEKQLLAILPGFSIKEKLMYISPVKGILRGIYFEASAFEKKSFYINVFVLPLCVPTKHLYFNFGKRLRHLKTDRWNFDSPNILEKIIDALKDQGLQFLSRAESLLEFVKVAKTFSETNPHTSQAIAYALFRAGEYEQAEEAFTQLIKRLEVKVAWQREMLDRAVALKSSLVKNPVEGQKTLAVYESQTIENLGLES